MCEVKVVLLENRKGMYYCSEHDCGWQHDNGGMGCIVAQQLSRVAELERLCGTVFASLERIDNSMEASHLAITPCYAREMAMSMAEMVHAGVKKREDGTGKSP